MSSRVVIAALLVLFAAPARGGTVALTFDDLPVFGLTKPVADGVAITRKLLRGLRAHRIPAKASSRTTPRAAPRCSRAGSTPAWRWATTPIRTCR
jgi:hypothetical protein